MTVAMLYDVPEGSQNRTTLLPQSPTEESDDSPMTQTICNRVTSGVKWYFKSAMKYPFTAIGGFIVGILIYNFFKWVIFA